MPGGGAAPSPSNTGTVHVDSRLALSWAAGALCTSASINFFGIMMLPFLTSRLGLSAALAGGLVSVTKFVGLAFDPLVGALSDRTRSRIGRRRPYLLLGSLLIPASLVLLFAPPGLRSVGQLSAYYVSALLLFGAAYAIFRVPYLTMSAEMTSDPVGRARMISLKIVAIAIGSIISTAALPALIDVLGSDRASYGKAATVMAAACMAAGLICFSGTRRGRFSTRQPARSGLFDQARTLLGNTPFLALIGAKAVHFSGAAFQISCGAYFVIYVMQQRLSVLALYFLIMTLASVASQPIWLALTRARGKRLTLALAALVVAAADMSWLWVGATGSVVALGIVAIAIGAAGGGLSLAMESMLPDLMALDIERTGLNREGAFAALFSLSEKLTSAVSLGLLGGFLQVFGFIASTKDVHQPASAIGAITAAMSFIPAGAAIAAMGLILAWGPRDDPSGLAKTSQDSSGRRIPP